MCRSRAHDTPPETRWHCLHGTAFTVNSRTSGPPPPHHEHPGAGAERDRGDAAECSVNGAAADATPPLVECHANVDVNVDVDYLHLHVIHITPGEARHDPPVTIFNRMHAILRACLLGALPGGSPRILPKPASRVSCYDRYPLGPVWVSRPPVLQPAKGAKAHSNTVEERVPSGPPVRGPRPLNQSSHLRRRGRGQQRDTPPPAHALHLGTYFRK